MDLLMIMHLGGFCFNCCCCTHWKHPIWENSGEISKQSLLLHFCNFLSLFCCCSLPSVM